MDTAGSEPGLIPPASAGRIPTNPPPLFFFEAWGSWPSLPNGQDSLLFYVRGKSLALALDIASALFPKGHF